MNIAQLRDYTDQATTAIAQASTADELAETLTKYAGRKSQLADWSKDLANLPNAEKAEFGKALNQAKLDIQTAADARERQLKQSSQPILDVSLPLRPEARGHIHPISQTIAEIVRIFGQLGMNFVEAPEVDYDWYVFESLNMPSTHPARDDWETFFADLPTDPEKGRPVLRPHTTNFELHVMEGQEPPIRSITVGKTYRRQADASHTPMFHQFEGLVVDKGLAIGNLVGTLDYFVHNFFGPETKTRLRPYHFRFTEPSFELDISCSVCKGVGCKLCKEGWLELGGAGMTHPEVLRNADLDPDEYTGYAWGFGVERCLAIRYGINDIRLIYDNDLRFLEQF